MAHDTRAEGVNNRLSVFVHRFGQYNCTRTPRMRTNLCVLRVVMNRCNSFVSDFACQAFLLAQVKCKYTLQWQSGSSLVNRNTFAVENISNG